MVKGDQKPGYETSGQDSHREADELHGKWKATIALLRTIPGIGILTVCWLVVITLNFALCDTAEAAVNFVGLAPITYQSGTSVRGHERVRTQLYVATLTAARFNPIINV